jgi:4-hydroxybenzoate polyprenyltransferase
MEYLKIAAQMVIGLFLFFMLITRFLSHSTLSWEPESLFLAFKETGPLGMVGKGLAYSAGIELAYMLFTPGPDEAIEPVIVGIAAAILVTVSKDTITIYDGLATFFLCMAMGGLFYLRGSSKERPKFFW